MAVIRRWVSGLLDVLLMREERFLGALDRWNRINRWDEED